MKTSCVVALATLAAVLPSPAPGAEGLTLEAALGRARQRSPVLRAARARATEAEARLRSRPALRENPEVEAALGTRRGRAGNDFEVGLQQTLELGGRGDARLAGEQAALARDAAEADQTERTVLRDVRAAFLRGLHAAERLRLARATEADAAELHHIAERRHASGDVAALEVNVAGSALARARAAVRGAEAAQAEALAELRGLLDLEPGEPLSLAGTLAEERSYDEVGLRAGLDQRPEIRALQAELQQAEAEVRLGEGLAWPEVTPGVRFEREQGDRVLWAGVRVTLPLFERGQQLRAAGGLRAERLRAEIEAGKRLLAHRLQGALAVADLRRAALRELAANADRLADNEALARRSYEVGQIGLAALLVVRRETVEARQEWLDSLLELAQARVELDSLAGGSR